MHRVAAKEREEVERTTKQKMADDITEKEGTTWIRKAIDRRTWKTLMEGYILQWMDKAQMKMNKLLDPPGYNDCLPSIWFKHRCCHLSPLRA